MSERNEVIADLRNVLDWLEKNPEVPMPYNIQELTIFPDGKDGFLKVAKQMGSFKKSSDESFFRITKEFGSVKVKASEWRESICTKKQVGTRKIEEKVVIKEEFEMVEKEVPVYEWECPDSLLAKNQQEEVSNV